MILKEIQTDITKIQKNVKNHFTNRAKAIYPLGVVAKSTASREKLNNKTLADSTPKRAFFVRDFRTSKINPAMDLFSMVGRNGQPLAVGCVPMFADSHPVTSYRPTVRSLAVVPENLTLELSAMNHKCPLTNQPIADTLVQKNILQQFAFFGYSSAVVAKSTAERQNSIDLLVANSTPKACFFVRSIHTPKERLELLESPECQSMVACNGKGFALCCVPQVAVSDPVTRYRPNVRAEAVTSLKNLLVELSKMTTYLFAGIVRTDLSNKIHTLRIEANSLLEAKSKLAKTHVLVLIGKLHNSSCNQVAEVANA